MARVTRDPSGKITTINGKTGQVLAWLKVLQPVMNAVVIAAILAAGPWILSVERTKDLARENKSVLDKAIDAGQLPLANARLSNLEAGQTEIKRELTRIALDLAALRGALAPEKIIGER